MPRYSNDNNRRRPPWGTAIIVAFALWWLIVEGVKLGLKAVFG